MDSVMVKLKTDINDLNNTNTILQNRLLSKNDNNNNNNTTKNEIIKKIKRREFN